MPVEFLNDFFRLFSRIYLEAKSKEQQLDSNVFYGFNFDNNPDNQKKIYDNILNLETKFEPITIDNLKIPVLFNSEDFVVVNLLQIKKKSPDDSIFRDFYCSKVSKENCEQYKIFLILKVTLKNNINWLKIGGVTYSNENRRNQLEFSSECRAKYLTYFLELNNISFPTNKRDIVDFFNRDFIGHPIINNNELFIKKSYDDIKGIIRQIQDGDLGYTYCFKLVNQLTNDEEIEKNINYYKSKLGGDTSEIENQGSGEENNHIFRNDALPIESPYYIRRRLDQKCESEIQNIAGFVRLKGVHKIGKTSLLYRIIEKGKSLNYSTIFIDFQDFESTYLDNVHNFCIRFCQEIASQLEKEDKTNSYFGSSNSESKIRRQLEKMFNPDSPSSQFESENELLSTTKLKDYFEKEFLTDETNILLVMDNIDKIFEQETLSQEIGNMLARWHKFGKEPTNKGQKWAKLKMVLAHSTDYYAGSPNINESPLQGIGVVPNEDEFDFQQEEIEKLANKYKVQLRQNDSQTIKNLTGGHPYLIRLSLEYLTNNNYNITNLLNIASRNDSPFIKYLRDEILTYLEKYPKYKEAFIQVLTNKSIRVDNDLELKEIEFKLGALGLIKKEGNNILPRCELYQNYFLRVLIDNEQSL